MLIAKDQNDCYVSLLTLSDSGLQRYRKKVLFCPCCSGRVFLKAGKIKMPHFAHAPHTVCHAASEGETEEHLLGKKLLYEWLGRQGYQPELEKYFPQIRQRADIFVQHDDKDYAIEYQCAVISPEEIKKRTKSYMYHGITPIWILSNRHVKWKKRNTFMLSGLQWTASFGTDLLPKLIAFSPEKSKLTILHQLTPFSERTVSAYPQIVYLHKLSFPELINDQAVYPFQKSFWLQKKRSWRLFANNYATVDQPFFRTLYTAGFSPATIPNECGIPVPYMHMYQTSAVLWQFLIFDLVLREKRAGDFVRLSEWRSALIHCLKEEKIILRHHACIRTNPFLPMEQYICMLVKMNVLKVAEGGHIYANPIEKFNTASAEKEEEFYEDIKRYYEELLERAEEKFD